MSGLSPSDNSADLILASSSRYRCQQLNQLGWAFRSIKPEVEELCLLGETAVNFSLRMAKAKAEVVAISHPNAWVIGADQVCEFEGEIIRKPGNHENAVKQLSLFSGKTVLFHSALSVVHLSPDQHVSNNTTTSVQFKDLSVSKIEAYLKADRPYDCAGAFKIESRGLSLMQSVESKDPSALVGLPLIALCDALQTLRYPGI